MTDDEMEKNGQPRNQVIQKYNKSNVTFSKQLSIHPVNLQSKDSKDQLFTALQYLDDMINDKGLNVLIHCSSGMTRSTTLAIIYLAMAKRHKNWDNLAMLDGYLRKYHVLSTPNLSVVQQVIDENKYFQDAALD